MFQAISEFYLIGFTIGILTAIHTIVFVRIAFLIQKKGLRKLWAYSYLIHLFAILLVLNWVINVEFSTVKEQNPKYYFILFWLIPYLISAVWCLWRYGTWKDAGRP
jgi:hypothetical protein